MLILTNRLILVVIYLDFILTEINNRGQDILRLDMTSGEIGI